MFSKWFKAEKEHGRFQPLKLKVWQSYKQLEMVGMMESISLV